VCVADEGISDIGAVVLTGKIPGSTDAEPYILFSPCRTLHPLAPCLTTSMLPHVPSTLPALALLWHPSQVGGLMSRQAHGKLAFQLQHRNNRLTVLTNSFVRMQLGVTVLGLICAAVWHAGQGWTGA
jgi:hypothetical protein